MKLRGLIWVVGAAIVVGAGGYAYFYYYTHRFDELIISQAREQLLDPRLVKSMIYEESFFDPDAESRAEARGLMQVTPIVIREWSNTKGYPNEQAALVQEFAPQMRARGLSAERLVFDPEVNLRLGCWYLRFLLNKYNAQPLQVPLALAGYNAGPSRAERWLRQGQNGAAADAQSAEEFLNRIDYPETRDYVRDVLWRYDSYKQSKGGL